MSLCNFNKNFICFLFISFILIRMPLFIYFCLFFWKKIKKKIKWMNEMKFKINHFKLNLLYAALISAGVASYFILLIYFDLSFIWIFFNLISYLLKFKNFIRIPCNCFINFNFTCCIGKEKEKYPCSNPNDMSFYLFIYYQFWLIFTSLTFSFVFFKKNQTIPIRNPFLIFFIQVTRPWT